VIFLSSLTQPDFAELCLSKSEVAATHCDFLAASIIPTLLTPSSPQSQTSVIKPSTYRKLLRIFL
jgi:hypothetical protein